MFCIMVSYVNPELISCENQESCKNFFPIYFLCNAKNCSDTINDQIQRQSFEIMHSMDLMIFPIEMMPISEESLTSESVNVLIYTLSKIKDPQEEGFVILKTTLSAASINKEVFLQEEFLLKKLDCSVKNNLNTTFLWSKENTIKMHKDTGLNLAVQKTLPQLLLNFENEFLMVEKDQEP